MNKDYQMVQKVVFVGDSGVGKTSLLRREATDYFTEEFVCTIGVDFQIKTYQVGNVSAKVQYWDTAGQERFRSIQKPYYRGSHAICVCFDLSNKESFDNLSHWIDEIRKFDVKGDIYLVGCKSDLPPEVPTDEILIFAEAHQVQYFQTSSKFNEGVNEGFRTLVETTVRKNLQTMAFSQIQKEDPLIANKQDKKKTCC